MIQLTVTVAAVLILAIPSLSPAGDLEEPVFELLERDGAFELRHYQGHVVATTTVTGDMDEAGTRAFRRLAGYIFGGNRTSAGGSEKIAMTAPVNMRREGSTWTMTFMMPSAHTLESLPTPDDPSVRLERWPGGDFAAVRFSGTWSPQRFEDHRSSLETWLEERGWKALGPPVIARYDPPWTPWFLRRNEILVPVASASAG